MLRCVLLVATIVVVSAVFSSSPAIASDWELVTPKAEWQARDSSAEMVHAGQMWIMGGWFDSFSEPPSDVWKSADGKNWERVAARSPWKHSDFPMGVSFRDRMFLMGGWHNGRLPDASASNQVWSSRDGADWKLETKDAGWSARMAGAVVVFQDKLWLLGGIQKYYFGDNSDLKNDVWCSDDGVNWTCVTEAAAWPARAYHQAVAFNGKLYVFGGGNYLPEYQVRNDVWCSEDGKTWTQLTEAAEWPPRIWFGSAVYRDRIWVLGGWSNNPARNWNDVWSSTDGKTWEQFKTPTIWKERHEHSVYVKDDAIWVAGGHAQPLSNEVWRLRLP
ncbi:MAG: galactose oxidase [Planctomycetaceae bacterium]|nr:galactose oxidase [Planctomycetaceae bacterium]